MVNLNDPRAQEFIEAVAACLVHLAQQVAAGFELAQQVEPAPLAQLYALSRPVPAAEEG